MIFFSSFLAKQSRAFILWHPLPQIHSQLEYSPGISPEPCYHLELSQRSLHEAIRKIFLYAIDSSGWGGGGKGAVHVFWVSPLGPPRTTSPLWSLHRKYLTCLSSPRRLFPRPRACFLPTDLQEDLLKNPLLGPAKPIPDWKMSCLTTASYFWLRASLPLPIQGGSEGPLSSSTPAGSAWPGCNY